MPVRRACSTLGNPSRGIIVLYILLIVATMTLIATVFFVRGRILMEQQIKDKLRSTATAAAMQFEDAPLERFTNENALQDREYLAIVSKLQEIRESISGVRFAYIMRKTNTEGEFAFIADADLALSESALDKNGNGTVDASESPGLPGEVYDASQAPALQEAYLHPTADESFTSDVWGMMMSGYAPIHNASGAVMGVLGVDMDAGDFTEISRSIFSPLALLLVLLTAIILSGIVLMAISRQQVDTLKILDTERAGLLRLTFHQLGGPLTILNWSLELLKEKHDSEDVKEHISVMEEAMNRLSNISNSLRDAERVHDGTMKYKPSVASLNAVILRSASEAKQLLSQSKQRLSLKLHADLIMRLDAKLIQAVMRELIGNAMDFSPPHSTITIITSRHGKYARVEVSDNGHGIPRTDISRLFQEFRRGSNATLYKSDGSGLGLYIVRGIIEQASGRIWLESEENKGTSVIFELPIV